jgi:hypothetical protein
LISFTAQQQEQLKHKVLKQKLKVHYLHSEVVVIFLNYLNQQEMNQRTAARATLDRIVKDYPDSDSAKVAKERLAALR